MEKITLYDHQSENISTNVVAFFEADGSLRVDGCDSGKLVKKIWGDFDYEYIITVKPSDLPKLLGVLKTTQEDLLAALARKFQGERAFSSLKKQLENAAIPFDFFTWA